MEKTNIMVEFCILGDEFNPEEITSKLLIEPSEQYLKGSRNARNIERKESCWSINTGYLETLFVSEVLDILLDKLASKKELILEIEKEMDLICKFFVVIKIEDKIKPAIYLDKRVIEFADFVGAEFDFDLYIF